MKKFLLPLTAAIIFCSCNSNSSEKKTQGADSSSNEKKVVRLNPSEVDVNKPINAVDANYQINCWNGKKIEVAGYGYVFYGDSLDTKTGLNLTDSMGGTKKLVDCRFVTPPTQLKVAKTDMIHIRGIVRGDFFGAVSLDSCEIIVVARSITTQPVDPFAKVLLSATDLWADYYKWEGKEISVIGDYYMTTTSTTAYGKTIRVDLKNPANYDKVVGCDFKEDPSAKINVNTKGVIIKGKIKILASYGYMMLEECSLVNR